MPIPAPLSVPESPARSPSRIEVVLPDGTLLRIAPERLLHLQRQGQHPAAHVRVAHRQPDPHTRRNRDTATCAKAGSGVGTAPSSPLITCRRHV